MTRFKLTIVAMLVFGHYSAGQNGPGGERLEQILIAWEARMSKIDSLTAKCQRTQSHLVPVKAMSPLERTQINSLTRQKIIYLGNLAFLKPDLTLIDFTRADEADKRDEEKTTLERMIFCGERMVEFNAKEHVINTWQRVPEKERLKTGVGFVNAYRKAMYLTLNALETDLFFVKGMKAAELKDRYEITLTKESEWYIYLYLKPRSNAKDSRFTAAQLTLYAKNPNEKGQPDLSMLPVRLWLRTGGSDETTFEFSDMRPNVKLERNYFEPKSIRGYHWRLE